MAYRGRGGRGNRGDLSPPYGGGGGGGGGPRPTSFVWPPPATTPRQVPAQFQVPMGYRAPVVLPHQAAYGPPAVVFRPSAPAPAPAAPQVSFSPALPAVPVTIRAPPSSATPAPSSSSTPAPAPRQLVQGAPTRASAPAPASSAPSAAALAKEVEKKLFVSETALAPPPAAAAAAVAAAQGAAASDVEDAQDVDLAPVSKKGLAHPARPGVGTVGKKVVIRANHFLVDVADNNLFHYDVAINPESKSRQTNREVLNELIKLHGKTALGGKLPAYDGRKSLYTAGPLPFESEEFAVTLVDPEKKEKERAEREYKITIRIAGRTDMYHLHQFLRGRQRDMPQETIQVLDVVLRESPSWNYVTVSRSFFSTTFGQRGDIGKGLECWRGYYQSLRPTQMGLSLNIDISATSFFKPVTVIKFVEFLSIRDTSRPLSDRDRVKIKKALRGVRIETSHQPDQIRRYKITGITPIPMSQLIFPVDEKGTRKTVVQYFWDKYNYRLKYGSWPCLQSGSDSRPVYLPMEVLFARLSKGKRYSKKLNDRQVTNILRVTCKRPQEREQSIRDMVLHNNYGEDKFAQEFGIKVSSDLISVPARVLPPPLLKYHDSGREKTCAPSIGQWNMINKKMINGGTIDNWTCLNFSRMCPEENVNPRPFVEVKSAAPNHIENALRDVQRRATQMLAQQFTGNQLQLLIIILPEVSGSYGKIKRVCETDIGIVSQCCLPKHASRPNKQYLENVALKINVKVGGRNTVLERAFVRNGIPFVSEVPSTIFGADVTHPPPGEDSASSIAAVVESMDWPEITKYRGLVSAQPHRQEIIEDLFTVSKDPQKGHNINGGMIRELLIAFRRKTKRRPERIIFYRDGISEGQFSHVLLHEMVAIRKACASLEERYLPPVTFVVVQKRHHTRLFPEVHGRRDMTDKSGKILPGTVVDQKICHPTEFDFFLCSHASIQVTHCFPEQVNIWFQHISCQGTSRPTPYHVLYDENHFNADALQSLTNNLCYTYARCTCAVSIGTPDYSIKESEGGSISGRKAVIDGLDEPAIEGEMANILYNGIEPTTMSFRINLDLTPAALAEQIHERTGMTMTCHDLLHAGKKLRFDLSLKSQGIGDLSSICLQPRLRGGRTCLNQYVSHNAGRFYNVINLDNNSVEYDLTDHACLLFSDLMHEFTHGLSTRYTWADFSLRCFEVENGRVYTRIQPLVPLTEQNLFDTCTSFANILNSRFKHNGKLPVYLKHLIHLLRTHVPSGDTLDPDFRFVLENHISFFPSKMREAVVLLLYTYYDSLIEDRNLNVLSDRERFDMEIEASVVNHDWLEKTKNHPVTAHMHKYSNKKGLSYQSTKVEAFRFIRNFTTHGPRNSVTECRRFRRYSYGRNMEVLIPHLMGGFIAELLYNLYFGTNRFKDYVRNLLKTAAIAR